MRSNTTAQCWSELLTVELLVRSKPWLPSFIIKCTVPEVGSIATVHPFDDRELMTGSGLPTPTARPVIQNSTVHGPLPGCRVGELGTVTTPLVALNERAGLGASSRSPPPAVPAATPLSEPSAKSACVVSRYEV